MDKHDFRRIVMHAILRLPSPLLRYSPLAGSRISHNLPLGVYLYYLCRALKPKVIVETGTAFGVSSAYMLRALEENGDGTLYSIDLPNATTSGRMDSRPTGYFIPGRFRGRWKLTIGDSQEELPKLLSELGQTDLFLHDSKHSRDHMLFEFRTAWPYVTKALVSDDLGEWAECREAFLEFARETGKEPVFVVNGRVGVLWRAEP